MDFPRTVGEITPEWLTQVLRESGAIGDASVRSRTVKTIGDDQGMTADVVRIGLSCIVRWVQATTSFFVT